MQSKKQGKGGISRIPARATVRKTQPKQTKQRPPSWRSGAFNTIEQTEPLEPIVVPADSQRGQRLFVTEVNPRLLGRILAAGVSQAQSWRGDFRFEMRVNGSVVAKNYAIARWLPDADISKLPEDPSELWRYVRARSSSKTSPDRAFVKYNVISNTERAFTVSTTWSQSYNPRKPVDDTDESERSHGVFIIVSNGPPGEEIVIDVDVHEDVCLYAPAPRSILLDNSVQLTAVPTSVSAPFGSQVVQSGNGSVDTTNNALTINGRGTYLVSIRYTGTAITSQPAINFTGITPSAGSITLSPTSAVDTFRCSVNGNSGILTFGPITATTFTGIRVYIAPFAA